MKKKKIDDVVMEKGMAASAASIDDADTAGTGTFYKIRKYDGRSHGSLK
jgi:hypothetical protein